MAMTSGFPSQNQVTLSVGGVHTDIICTSYSDRHFVVVTQLQKLGTLVSDCLCTVLLQVKLRLFPRISCFGGGCLLSVVL
jgi:hypothetical protein